MRVVDGVPKLFVKGQELQAIFTQVYYYGPLPGGPSYGPTYVTAAKKVIDDSAQLSSSSVVLLPIWWNEVDKSTEKPASVAANLDFGPIEEVLDYASSRSVHIVLQADRSHYLPEWWKKEQGFPAAPTPSPCIPAETDAQGTLASCIPKAICPEDDSRCCKTDDSKLVCCKPQLENGHAKRTEDLRFVCDTTLSTPSYPTCTACETDSFGWKFNYPSMGSQQGVQDYGQYVSAVVQHLKDRPALLGWNYGIGPSDENTYGPDYTQAVFLFDDLYWSADSDQLADYSEYFQQEFAKWLQNKYATNADLQAAWGDTSLDLTKVRIPAPKRLFAHFEQAKSVFPDDFNYPWLVTLDALTVRGRDFYAFREHMKKVENDYYTSLFKQEDPNHVLFATSIGSTDLLQNPNIDGFKGNPRVNYEKGGMQAYISPLLNAELCRKHNKYPFIILEDVYQTKEESKNQVDCLIRTGKATRCFGGGFGYVSAFPVDGGLTMAPDWRSDADKQAIRDILSYQPASDCTCEYLNPAEALTPSISVGSFLGSYGIDATSMCPSKSVDGGLDAQPADASSCSAPCDSGSVCCPSGLSCSGQCVTDCRLSSTPCPSLAPACDADSGVCK